MPTRSLSTTLPLAAALLLAACTEPAPAPLAAPDQTYAARGVVRQLPDPTRPGGGELLIAHEAVPDFVDSEGQEVGMAAMTMPFALADPALLDGLAAGDKIGFDFEVRWQGGPPLRITRVERLPVSTRLSFERGD